MREVSKADFYKPIFEQRLDVQPRITSDRFPYTSLWEFHRSPGRPVYGKTVDRVEGGRVLTSYFVSEGR